MKTSLKFITMIAIAFALTLNLGCSRDDDDDPDPVPSDPTFNVKLDLEVDGEPLKFNQELYVNEDGSAYAVDRVQLYVSAFEFQKIDGTWLNSISL